MSKELEPIQSNELATTTDDDLFLTMDDIVLPRIYLQNGLSDMVKAGDAKVGDLMVATSADDPDATKIADRKSEPVRMYVLAANKRWGYFPPGELPEFGPIGTPRPTNDRDAWDIWFYYVYIPSLDDEIPVRWRLQKTAGRVSYQNINTIIMKERARGNHGPVCIECRIGERKNAKGQEYPVVLVTAGASDPDELAKAEGMHAMAKSLASEREVENEAPDVNEQPSFS